VTAIRETLPDADISVVNDGSGDNTATAAIRAGAELLSFPTNRGKGAALSAGVGRAIETGADVIVTIDADGQHPAADIPRLMEPVLAGQADFVIGARSRTGAMPPQRRLSNWLSSALVTRIAGNVIPDSQSGFRAFARRVAQHVQPDELHYDYELAFLLGALQAGFRVTSVPVATIYDGATSYFRTFADTWRIARVFARHGGGILRGRR
jgi:glycosyltransferase involved in cell wall biosynthesis